MLKLNKVIFIILLSFIYDDLAYAGRYRPCKNVSFKIENNSRSKIKVLGLRYEDGEGKIRKRNIANKKISPGKDHNTRGRTLRNSRNQNVKVTVHYRTDGLRGSKYCGKTKTFHCTDDKEQVLLKIEPRRTNCPGGQWNLDF